MQESNNQTKRKIDPSQWRLFLFVLVIGLAGFVFSILRGLNLQDSAALYVGLPVLLALGLSLTSKAKSTIGATMKGTTIALLLAAPVFQEGYICILFAAPIFYFIGILVSGAIDHARKKGETKGKLQTAVLAIVLSVTALEGATDLTSFPRDHQVAATKVINAPISQVRAQIAKTPEFTDQKPLFLRIFPYPVKTQGDGLNVGDERRITFVAYKHIFWNRVEGDSVFSVKEASKNEVKFALESDNSYVGHYIKWKDSTVSFEAIDQYRTKVTWKLSFHRKHDPYWYFGTLQNYAAKLVAEELIDHVATPRN